jgi:prolyl-tRNA editing enzyme YbaK/EbsC (Cys-tRNA(Pro) deacylase)
MVSTRWIKEIMMRGESNYEDLSGRIRLEGPPGVRHHCTARMAVAVVDGRPVALLFPASRRVVLDRLGRMLGADDVRLVACDEGDRILGGHDAGASRPLPDLSDVSLLMDATLLSARAMEVRSPDGGEPVRLSLEDWLAAANPGLGFFTEPDRETDA